MPGAGEGTRCPADGAVLLPWRRGVARGGHSLGECPLCRLIWTLPLKTDAELAPLYADRESKDFVPGDIPPIAAVKDAIARAQLARLKPDGYTIMTEALPEEVLGEVAVDEGVVGGGVAAHGSADLDALHHVAHREQHLASNSHAFGASQNDGAFEVAGRHAEHERIVGELRQRRDAPDVRNAGREHREGGKVLQEVATLHGRPGCAGRRREAYGRS